MDFEIDCVKNTDCLEYMKTLPDSCIDTVITSPPYAEQRVSTYGGISAEDFPSWMEEIGKEIYRILKPSGSFVLNIKEHVNNGRRDTYVLKTVLLLSEIFIWSDTFIWNKPNPFPTGGKKRLKDGFEYCYLFTKTKDHKFNPENVLSRNKSLFHRKESLRQNKIKRETTNGSNMNMGGRCSPDMVRPSNVLTLPTDNSHHEHPATFPIGLPNFFIKLLTDENDLVFDPFAGSGTTLISAKNLNRHYIGCEIKNEYVNIIKKRMGEYIEEKGDSEYDRVALW